MTIERIPKAINRARGPKRVEIPDIQEIASILSDASPVTIAWGDHRTSEPADLHTLREPTLPRLVIATDDGVRVTFTRTSTETFCAKPKAADHQAAARISQVLDGLRRPAYGFWRPLLLALAALAGPTASALWLISVHNAFGIDLGAILLALLICLAGFLVVGLADGAPRRDPVIIHPERIQGFFTRYSTQLALLIAFLTLVATVVLGVLAL